MKINLLLFFLLVTSFAFSQGTIDLEQKRIDGLDGKVDNFLSLRDLNARNSATYTYIELIDEIQKVIDESKQFSVENKKLFFKALENELIKIDPNRLTKATRDEKRYTFLLEWINAYENGTVATFMQEDQSKIFSIINYIYPFTETEKFLKALPNNYIDQILYNYNSIEKASYGQGILEELVLKAPLTSQKYFKDEEAVYSALKQSTDPSIKLLIALNERYGSYTKAFVLLDKIVNDLMSLDRANTISNNKNEYLKSLLQIRAKNNPIAEVSLDRELNYEALEYVEEINHLHEQPDPNVRFAITNPLSAEELYTLIVYSEDEIFTSSFNGIYDRLYSKMKNEKKSGYTLLKNVGFNRFRTFIKMISYYGKLSGFLKTMKPKEKDLVLREFVGGIKASKNRIEDAVSIANAISAIEDPEILKIFEEEIYHINTLEGLDTDTRLIYSLLIKMFKPKVQIYHSFFDSISKLYHVPPIDKIEISAILGRDGINVQKHFFYDDEDGVASYNSFKNSFNNDNWKLIDMGEYIKLISINHRVKIYANKPANDETAWYYADKEIKKHFEDVEIVIHRGHSYYVDETIEKLPKSTKLILLGSCGGYNRLSQLLNKSDNAQIISTKQIGSMGVNNPLIFQMAEKIRKGEDLVWASYWSSLSTYFKGRGKSEERFADYVPPHQNLGAKFISAYNMYKWVK